MSFRAENYFIQAQVECVSFYSKAIMHCKHFGSTPLPEPSSSGSRCWAEKLYLCIVFEAPWDFPTAMVVVLSKSISASWLPGHFKWVDSTPPLVRCLSWKLFFEGLFVSCKSNYLKDTSESLSTLIWALFLLLCQIRSELWVESHILRIEILYLMRILHSGTLPPWDYP